MEEFITVTAKTVKDAVLEASLKLETFRDNIEYEVIEEGSTGFLGFGGKKAVIKARKKTTVEDILEGEPAGEAKKEEKTYVKPERKEFKREKKEVKEQKKEFKKETKREFKEVKKEEKREEKQEKSFVLESEDTKIHQEPEEGYHGGFESSYHHASEEEASERHERKVAVLNPEEQEEAKQKAEKFLKDVFASIDMEVGISVSYVDEMVDVELSGDDMGILIGKRGQTLDSLQYLTSLVVNKGTPGYIRVKVDTENYRSRRKETLENLAKNIAFKVKRTRRPVFLEPMNPYERRIIHSALQNDPYVTTHSEGEEPYRKVVVTLKRNR